MGVSASHTPGSAVSIAIAGKDYPYLRLHLLSCLLNLNGNNLLGSLVNVHGVTGGAGGAGPGGAGILNTLLNGK